MPFSHLNKYPPKVSGTLTVIPQQVFAELLPHAL